MANARGADDLPVQHGGGRCTEPHACLPAELLQQFGVPSTFCAKRVVKATAHAFRIEFFDQDLTEKLLRRHIHDGGKVEFDDLDAGVAEGLLPDLTGKKCRRCLSGQDLFRMFKKRAENGFGIQACRHILGLVDDGHMSKMQSVKATQGNHCSLFSEIGVHGFTSLSKCGGPAYRRSRSPSPPARENPDWGRIFGRWPAVPAPVLFGNAQYGRGLSFPHCEIE